MMVKLLRPEDRVSIVTYAGSAGLVLDATPGTMKEDILFALDQLEAGGFTAGGAGINLAYDVAKRNFIPGGNNRVILCTDGDFNIGVSSTGDLERLIEEDGSRRWLWQF
ncbi:MAG: von Willebrand factor type A [Spirochaetes bacterium]|nr:MAG: von Willebrand factor type A [Spirochaetota bacterium]